MLQPMWQIRSSLVLSPSLLPKSLLPNLFQVVESRYQKHVIDTLSEMLPGCIVIKVDALYQQGFPDLLILWNERWAALEVKSSEDAVEQPNQMFFVETLNMMSFAAFIYPENEEEVLNALQQAFRPPRRARVS
jgi:hypothetical protein